MAAPMSDTNKAVSPEAAPIASASAGEQSDVSVGASRPNSELVNELPNTETVPLYTMQSKKLFGLYQRTVEFYPTCLVFHRERRDGQGKLTVMPKYQLVGYECRKKTFPKWIAVCIPLLVWFLIFMFHPVYGKDGSEGECPKQECEEEGSVAVAKKTCDRYDIPWTVSSQQEMPIYTTTLPPPTPEPTAAPAQEITTAAPTAASSTAAPTGTTAASVGSTTRRLGSWSTTAGPAAGSSTSSMPEVATGTSPGDAASCGGVKDGHQQIDGCCIADYGPGGWIALQVILPLLLAIPIAAWFCIRTPPDWCHVKLRLRNTWWDSWFFAERWTASLHLSKEPDHAFLRQYIYGPLQPKMDEYHAHTHLKRNSIRAFPSTVSSAPVPAVQADPEPWSHR
jgi:hypothetical protein